MFKRLTLMVLPLLLTLSGCDSFFLEKENPETPRAQFVPDPVAGSWLGSASGFEISGTTFTYYSDTESTVGFVGTIVNSPDLSAEAGALTLRVTDVGMSNLTANRYLVVRWADFLGLEVGLLVPTSVLTLDNTAYSTAPAAESEFTIANGYFSSSATCYKQGGLLGYWVSSYGDGIELSGADFMYYGDPGAKVFGSMGFSGTVVNSPDLSASEGLLVVEIASSGTYGPSVGKYYGVRWRGLTSTGLQESAAYKTGSSYNSGTDSVEDATTEYTLANGYFTYFGDYLKQ